MKRNDVKGKIRGKITGIEELAKLPFNCTIVNANALDMTPEEFKEVQRKSAESILKLKQIDPKIVRQNMDV